MKDKCPDGKVHILDPQEVGICVNCKLVHFFCTNCGDEIAKMPLRDSPKKTRDIALMLQTALEENGVEA